VANILWSAVSFVEALGNLSAESEDPGVVRSQSNDATAEIAGVGQAWASPDCARFPARRASDHPHDCVQQPPPVPASLLPCGLAQRILES